MRKIKNGVISDEHDISVEKLTLIIISFEKLKFNEKINEIQWKN